MKLRTRLTALVVLLFASSAPAAAPPPPAESAVFPWNVGWPADGLRAMDASSLVPKPAGASGPVVVRDGHFYSGDQRVRFWGVNTCFSGNFPTHEQADVVARRLASLGFNIVRFHHLETQTYPAGIFKDEKSFDLHPEALDRLDYFIAALKREGVYANLNLRVGRRWSKVLGLENADKLPQYDKLVDLFDPRLIEPQKRYAKDLLHHVNPYTKSRYADEPAVAMVEINNENTLFFWGGEDQIANFPEPYAGQLQALWNDWLVKRHGSREKLAAAWGGGDPTPTGAAGLLKDTAFATLNTGKSAWAVEQHAPAKMTVARDGDAGVTIDVAQVDGTDWHLQFNQPGLTVKAGTFYTLSFTASATKRVGLGATASMAHAPWGNLGLQRQVTLTTEPKEYRLGFTASKDDTNGRVSFAVGDGVATIRLSNVSLREGGREGLRAAEDPARGTVARSGAGTLDSPERLADWYRFLQATDEKYFVSMRQFLKGELGVQAPVTGTIGLGMLGTMGQSKMDFVDSHIYWDHPSFPGGRWSTTNWTIHNRPMADEPAKAALWTLAATRVEGKPFTVTEYNHSAPNEWQAETIPMIAAYAGAQDWDGVFLFAYSHGNNYKHGKQTGFFDLEGNAAKMAHLTTAARLFHRVAPVRATRVVAVSMDDVLPKASAYYFKQAEFLGEVMGVKPADFLGRRVALRFVEKSAPAAPAGEPDPRFRWTASGAGTGRFALADPAAVAFAGFVGNGESVDLGAARIDASRTPFVTLTLVPADAGQSIAAAPRLLLSVAARATNTGMKWDAARHTVGGNWGAEPSLAEKVDIDLSVGGKPVKAFALGQDGERGAAVPTEAGDGRTVIKLGEAKSLWFELVRE